MTPDRDRLTPPLPTFEELAKQLCKIVDTDHYSREEAKRTLVYLYRWGYTDVAQFLSNFSELGVSFLSLPFFTTSSKSLIYLLRLLIQLFLSLTATLHDIFHLIITGDSTGVDFSQTQSRGSRVCDGRGEGHHGLHPPTLHASQLPHCE